MSEVQAAEAPESPAAALDAAGEVPAALKPPSTPSRHARKPALRKRPQPTVIVVPVPLDPEDEEPAAKAARTQERPVPSDDEQDPRARGRPVLLDNDTKGHLLEQLLAFQLGSDAKLTLPDLPQDGKFEIGVEQYVSVWGHVVVGEFKAQALSEIGRSAHSAGAMAVEPSTRAKDSWQLNLLCGDWAGQGVGAGRLVITANAQGKLCLSQGGCGLQVELAPPVAGNWRRARFGALDLQVRLRDWNTLEVLGKGVRRRARGDVRVGSIILVAPPLPTNGQGAAGCLQRIGVVERKQDSAMLRLASGACIAGQVQAHLLSVSPISSSRELQAVWGIEALPRQLRKELLGAPPFYRAEELVPTGPERAIPPCLKTLNPSQLKAVEVASRRGAGFTLVWGPPGTGKSSTLLALINALHLREYEKLHTAIEQIVLGKGEGGHRSRSTGAQWQAAVRKAPRLLVTASSNAAVEGLLDRVCKSKLLDRQGNVYEPWSMVRLGTDRGGDPRQMDLDARVRALLEVSFEKVEGRKKEVSNSLKGLNARVLRLCEEVQQLQKALPLPLGWEARLSETPGLCEFHDHVNKRASWHPPDPPPRGAPCVQLFDLPDAVTRLAELIQCADRWWQLQGEAERLSWLGARNPANWDRPDRALKEKLEGSILGTAQIVFATANSSARLRPFAVQNEPFGAVVVDEAAQASEPSTLVPLELARSRTCVLVGDDRQLPPTVFTQGDHGLISRTLFERLRQCGHTAELLDEQYRMAPEISAFPRTFFYGGALHDAPMMLERTRRKLHKLLPPLLFLDLGSSKTERSPDGSWRNMEEAMLCAEVLVHIRKVATAFGEEERMSDVGVITPYRAQQESLRQLLRGPRLQMGPNTVATVDGYQGRECEVIVFNTVRAPEAAQNSKGIGFLADERRLNVALTRAKSLLVVVGHARTLVQSKAWNAFLQHVRSIPGAYLHVPNIKAVAGIWDLMARQAQAAQQLQGIQEVPVVQVPHALGAQAPKKTELAPEARVAAGAEVVRGDAQEARKAQQVALEAQEEKMTSEERMLEEDVAVEEHVVFEEEPVVFEEEPVVLEEEVVLEWAQAEQVMFAEETQGLEFSDYDLAQSQDDPD